MKAKYTKKAMKRRVKKTDRENHSEHYNSFLTCEISKVAVHITNAMIFHLAQHTVNITLKRLFQKQGKQEKGDNCSIHTYNVTTV